MIITAFDSLQFGEASDVFKGACLVLVGSALHSATYVLSEAIMTRGREPVPVRVNLALQGVVACGAFLLWQAVYTLPRFEVSTRSCPALQTQWCCCNLLRRVQGAF